MANSDKAPENDSDRLAEIERRLDVINENVINIGRMIGNLASMVELLKKQLDELGA